MSIFLQIYWQLLTYQESYIVVRITTKRIEQNQQKYHQKEEAIQEYEKEKTEVVDTINENDKLNTNLNDLSEICCGCNEASQLMFIYVTEQDIHYFFECK